MHACGHATHFWTKTSTLPPFLICSYFHVHYHPGDCPVPIQLLIYQLSSVPLEMTLLRTNLAIPLHLTSWHWPNKSVVHKGQDFQAKRGRDIIGLQANEGFTSSLSIVGGTMARSAGGDSECLFLTFGGAGWRQANGISLLGKILAYKI